MERKSIGQFIAALRKSRGYTQAQLAEMLNVSDKAVSRWERDESAPDLSLIPVIAEIFEVTADEILRGERINAEEPKSSDRPKKQMERLLNDAKTKFRVRSILSLGIGVIGLLAAMLCNFGFLRAYIGFIVACVFYVAAIGLEIVFAVLGFASVSHDDFDGQKLRDCKKHFIRLAGFTATVIIVMFSASLPLVTLPWDAYVGITAGSWLTHSIPCILIALLVCGLIYMALDHIALNQGVLVLTEKETVKRQLRKRYAILLVIVLIITFIGQFLFNSFVSAENLSDVMVFYTPEDFITFMEEPVADEFYIENGEVWIIEGIMESDVDEVPDSIPFYDSDGKETTYAYIMRNHTVTLFTHERNKDGSTKCYKVYTNEMLLQGSARLLSINICWRLFYGLEAAVIAILYFRKCRAVLKMKVDR